MSYDMEYPFFPVGVSCPVCSHPNSLWPPSLLTSELVEKLKKLLFSVNTVQQQPKHQCVNIILILSPKYSTWQLPGWKLTLSWPKPGHNGHIFCSGVWQRLGPYDLWTTQQKGALRDWARQTNVSVSSVSKTDIPKVYWYTLLSLKYLLLCQSIPGIHRTSVLVTVGCFCHSLPLRLILDSNS